MCNTALFFIGTTIIFLGSTIIQTIARNNYKKMYDNARKEPKIPVINDMKEDFDKIIINFD